QDRGYTGTVVVEVAVDGSTGSATDVRLVQGTGQPSLDEAALLYITHRARFERASSDYIVQVEIHYNRNVGSGGRSTYEVVIVTRDRVVFVPGGSPRLSDPAPRHRMERWRRRSVIRS